MKKNNIGYLLREGIRGVFLHGFMSFAAVGITVACLLIMGTFTLVAWNANALLEDLERENEILAYVDESYTGSQAQALKNTLEKVPNVASATFISRAEAMERFAEQHPDEEEGGNDPKQEGLHVGTLRVSAYHQEEEEPKDIPQQKGQQILQEGDPARYVGIVLAGGVQIEKVDYYGNRSIVASVGPGELFGEAFACAEMESMPVAVVAGEPCQVMLIDCRRILRSCTNACGFHQQLIFNLMKDIAVKNIMFHQKIEITSRRSTREKLMAYLQQQAKQAGTNRFEIPFDRQELADYLEVDRSGLSAEISRLRREGVLESHKKQFELL